MKEGLGTTAVARIARSIAAAFEPFDTSAFTSDALEGLQTLELKARVVHIAAALRAHLPEDFDALLNVLVAAAPSWDRGEASDSVSGFAAWPMLHLIGEHGVTDDTFEASLEALRRLSHLFTSEFSVRPFLIADQQRALAVMATWLDDPDEHVRRLVSEGTRPRLPWGSRLQQLVTDPTPALPLLEGLKDDPSLYVRRSVANHLNDIAKDHADLVVLRCNSWLEGADAERLWVIRHATRTLVKQGHPGVWALLGYTNDPQVAVSGLALGTSTLKLGGALDIRFELRSCSAQEQSMVVDFVVHHRKANGTLAPKVFKLKSIVLQPKSTITLTKRHPIRPISTRKYHAGMHRVEIVVNGTVHASAEFKLLT